MRYTAFFVALAWATLASAAQATPVAIYAAPPALDLAQAITATPRFDPSRVVDEPAIRDQAPLTPAPAIVPEPTAWTYLVVGFIGVGGGARARRLSHRRGTFD